MHTQIKIFTVLNGWVVQAGCQLIAYTDKGELMGDFTEWLMNPAEAEKRILAKACNRKVVLREAPGMPVANAQGQPPDWIPDMRLTATQVCQPATEPMHGSGELSSLLHNQTR